MSRLTASGARPSWAGKTAQAHEPPTWRAARSLGRPDAMAAELAQLAALGGRLPWRCREWLLAVRRLPGYRATAVSTLSQAPERVRPELLRLLTAEPDLMSRRIESELRAVWGDPWERFRVLEGALPPDRVQAIGALQGLLDQLRTLRTAEGQQAQGKVLEAISERVPPSSGIAASAGCGSGLLRRRRPNRRPANAGRTGR